LMIPVNYTCRDGWKAALYHWNCKGI